MGIHDWAKTLINLTTQELDDTLFVMSDEDWICEEYKSLLRNGGIRPYKMTVKELHFMMNVPPSSKTRPYTWHKVFLVGMFRTVTDFLVAHKNRGKSLWFWVSDDLGEILEGYIYTTFNFDLITNERVKVSREMVESLYAPHSLPREVIDRFWFLSPHPYIEEHKIVPNVMGPFANELSAWTALLCAINNGEVEKSNDKLKDQDDAETGTTIETPPKTLAEELHSWTGW